jgi:hypothetical protein
MDRSIPDRFATTPSGKTAAAQREKRKANA